MEPELEQNQNLHERLAQRLHTMLAGLLPDFLGPPPGCSRPPDGRRGPV